MHEKECGKQPLLLYYYEILPRNYCELFSIYMESSTGLIPVIRRIYFSKYFIFCDFNFIPSNGNTELKLISIQITKLVQVYQWKFCS